MQDYTGGNTLRKLSFVLLLVLNVGLGFVLFDGVMGQDDPQPAAPLDSGFTYQGRLDVAGAPANGVYDFQFRLFDAASGGSQVGGMVNVDDVPVTDGLFNVMLDFGAGAFDGEARWLELAVRDGSSTGGYNHLLPLQQLSASPYALYSMSAPWGGLTGIPTGFVDGVDGVEYENVIVVAKSGGDYTSIQAALDSITDAGADNAYLVYVAPGVYEEQVTMKPYVTLEGAGEGVSIIRWTGGEESPGDGTGSVTLSGADNAELRHLTVETASTGAYWAVAMHNDNASPSITHVTLNATGGTRSYGLYNRNTALPALTNVTVTASGASFQNFGVSNASSSPTMTNVTATAAGGSSNFAIYSVSGSSATLTNVTARALGATGTNYGSFNTTSTTTILNSVIEGQAAGYSVHRSGGTVKVANSQLSGAVSSGVTCFNNYDANLAAVACP